MNVVSNGAISFQTLSKAECTDLVRLFSCGIACGLIFSFLIFVLSSVVFAFFHFVNYGIDK